MAISSSYSEALAAGDAEALAAAVAEDVALYGPITEEPAEGREAMVGLLTAARAVLQSLTVASTTETDSGDIVIFDARLNDDVEFELLHVVQANSDGLVQDVRAYSRPLKNVAQWAMAAAPGHGKPPLPGMPGGPPGAGAGAPGAGPPQPS